MIRSEAALEAFLTQEQNSLVGELLEMIKIPGVCVEGGPAIRRMAELAARKCEAAGLLTRLEETPGHPIVYAVGGPEDASFTLMLYGHYDVFPAVGQSGWRTDPFEPVVIGDRIFARGSGDNKAQFMSHLVALRWWHHHAGGLPIRVKVILEGEEEAGSRNLPDFARRNQAELCADLCVYSDGPMLAQDQPALLFGARGALVMKFHSSGAARPLHSGSFGGMVANPINELGRFFTELVAPNGDLRADGINDGLPAATAEEQMALDALDVDLDSFRQITGTDPLPYRYDEGYYERLLYKPYFNISGLQGGYTGDGFRTLIPESATATVDLRLVGDQDPDHVFACIERFIEDREFSGIKVQKIMSQPPSRTALSHPYARLVYDAVAKGFARAPQKVPSLAGTTPDYVFTKMLGMPSIMVPIAPFDENHHGPNESMKISLFMGGIRAYTSLVGLIAREYGVGAQSRGQITA